jgi:hypothetical protein
MKIRLSERQYKKMIKENSNPIEERLFNHFFDRVKNLNFRDSLDVYFGEFGFDERIMLHSKRLYDWFKYSFGKEGNISLHGFNKGIYKLFGVMDEKETDTILNSGLDDLKKLKSMARLYNSLPRSYDHTKIGTIIDGLIYDTVQYLFKKYEPKEAVKQCSILVDYVGIYRFKEVVPIVKDFAEKNGLVLIPKHKGYTFEKSDESMIRDLVNYMKDVPEIPKKTKNGFLGYLGRNQGRGQYSTFWSAVNKAGIIQKVRVGNNITYQLGPNYKAWEDGNVIAF